MCTVSERITPKSDLVDEWNLFDVYRCETEYPLFQTRILIGPYIGIAKFQCRHATGNKWEDSPELSEGQQWTCPLGTEVRLVPIFVK